MRENFGLLILLFCVIYFIFISVRSLLIGLGKWKNPMYDTLEKKKYILKRGIIWTIISSIFGIPLIVIYLIIVLS